MSMELRQARGLRLCKVGDHTVEDYSNVGRTEMVMTSASVSDTRQKDADRGNAAQKKTRDFQATSHGQNCLLTAVQLH